MAAQFYLPSDTLKISIWGDGKHKTEICVEEWLHMPTNDDDMLYSCDNKNLFISVPFMTNDTYVMVTYLINATLILCNVLSKCWRIFVCVLLEQFSNSQKKETLRQFYTFICWTQKKKKKCMWHTKHVLRDLEWML